MARGQNAPCGNVRDLDGGPGVFKKFSARARPVFLFTEYSDVTVRRLVEYIRVMKDNSIIIVLKGGIQIREPIETNN